MPVPLFEPITPRGITAKNRLALSPMCQYSAVDGMFSDWHFANLARFALGGFGIVIVEATTIALQGRLTYGDLGIWKDEHIAPLSRLTAFLKEQGIDPKSIKPEVIHSVEKLQRVFHLAGTYDKTEGLLAAGFGSAADIVAAGKSRFVTASKQ